MENISKSISDNIPKSISDNIPKSISDNIPENITGDLSEKVKDTASNLKTKLISFTPYGTENFLESSNEFLSSNTLIAKATFLLFIIILFTFLYYIFSKIVMMILLPSENPYILYGMKDATQSMIIPQSMADKRSIPIMRSKNEYQGIEFTYSFWLYSNDTQLYNSNQRFKHVFHKGATNETDMLYKGVYLPNNCPGVYLYTGKKDANNSENNLIDKYPLLGLLIRVNVYHNNDNEINPYKYYDDIFVDGIPIKKWVNVIIRSTSQNIVDIYINGTLTKRHKLSNTIKQNYDNLYINMNGGFSGNLSNLKYYNYAIETMEIYNIASSGPNLKISSNNNIEKAIPYYLSNQWYFNDTDIVE